MTEFVNCEVTLLFNDGTNARGFISHVDSTLIALGNKSYPNAQIKDLKVNQLPPEYVKEHRKKNKKKPTDIVDSAIVSMSKSSSRAETPKTRESAQSEWPTNVQDIKSSDEFDFAANLAMFDKKSIFADFQKNDKVSQQDRLVGHNKKENVQKQKKQPLPNDKFDNDEMVIPAGKQDNWNILGSSTKRINLPLDAGIGNATPHLGRELFSSKPHKFIFPDKSTLPTASPVQLLEIERIAGESFAYTQKSMIEITAMNLYNMVVREILGGAVRLSNRKNHNLPPLVLLLIGNGRTSSRAFALGRHLTNHGVRVLAYIINDSDLDEETRRESEIFEKFGGKCVSSEFSVLLDILNNQLETPVELIVDALQGFEGHLLDIFYTDESLRTLKELCRWANEPKQRSRMLSLDVPSGIDGGSGTVLDLELLFHSRFIASLGLPITGLLHAYNNRQIGAGHDEVSHYVIDAGIPNALYNVRASLRKFDKFWYCAELYILIDVEGQ